MLDRIAIPLAALFGAMAVILGAFGAHALQESLSTSALKTWNTAVTYHMFHGIVVLLIGFARTNVRDRRWIDRAFWCFCLGILCFSGSLYLLAIAQLKSIAYVTPIGGVMFICGWIAVAWHGYMKP